MCAQPLEAFSSFPRTFSVFAGKGLPAVFCALQGGAVPCQAPLPSETRQNSASRHQKGRNHPPCAPASRGLFLLSPCAVTVFAGKGLPAAFCALQGGEKPDLWREITLSQAQNGKAQASPKAEPYRVRLPLSAIRPHGRAPARRPEKRKRRCAGLSAALRAKKTPASRERPALSDRKKG